MTCWITEKERYGWIDLLLLFKCLDCVEPHIRRVSLQPSHFPQIGYVLLSICVNKCVLANGQGNVTKYWGSNVKIRSQLIHVVKTRIKAQLWGTTRQLQSQVLEQTMLHCPLPGDIKPNLRSRGNFKVYKFDWIRHLMNNALVTMVWYIM